MHQEAEQAIRSNGFQNAAEFPCSAVGSAAITSWQSSPITAHTLAGARKLFALNLLYPPSPGEQVRLGTLGSVPRGRPFTLMETHNGKGGQRRELGSFCCAQMQG